jgi:predicted DsbA family dithiol-disulfide isomerase
MMAERLTVEVWFDLICPWCLIGRRHLQTALRLLRDRHPDVIVTTRWHSAPLLPGIPVGGVPFAEFYVRRLGSARAVALRQAQVREAARAAGVDIDFERIAVFPNTLAAHGLVAQAERAGGAAAAERVIDALLENYFQLGQDIGSPTTLRSIAGQCGIVEFLPIDPRDGSEARHGVPTFLFNEAVLVEGAQPPAALLQAMERSMGLPG